MKRLLLKLVVAILTFTIGLSIYSMFHRHENISNRTEAEATNRTYEFYEAIERHDKETLNNLIAEDCIITFNRNFLVDDKPYTISKTRFIFDLANPEYNFSISTVNTNTKEDKTKVTVSGDLLLYGEQQSKDMSYHFKHTYTSRQGRLQLVSAEITRQDWPKGWSHKQH